MLRYLWEILQLKGLLEFILLDLDIVVFHQSWSDYISYLLYFVFYSFNKARGLLVPFVSILPNPFTENHIHLQGKETQYQREERPKTIFLCTPGVSGWFWMESDSHWSWCQTVVVSHSFQSQCCCRDVMRMSKGWVYGFWISINK